MNISKDEATRILKAVAINNRVNAVTLRKNDTQTNKTSELRNLVSSAEQKMKQGKEVTIVVIETH